MTETSQMRPAVFLDRDGTIIKDADYLKEVDQLEVFEFTVEALRLLKAKGYLLIVLTNQSGIARGFFDEEQMRSVNNALQERLDGSIDAIYFCPHGPDDACDCRKPKIGMIKQAANEFSIDLANSWIIGDKKSDIETGFNAGIATALVLTGYGESELATLNRMPELVAGDLLEAARQICSRTD
jgi:D-glycero-D-manno-heptose 1,7-bisphosphate phosphatase